MTGVRTHQLIWSSGDGYYRRSGVGIEAGLLHLFFRPALQFSTARETGSSS